VLCTGAEALAGRLPQGTLVFGSGVRAYPDAFGTERFRVGRAELAVGRAEATARLGAEYIRRGRDVDPMQLVPRYYRLTAPEEKLQKAFDENNR